ncbi:MAG: hypothetical protein K2H09_07090 [Treponemataceae bacterium]|nr:hypothetical protein [Treponemataceae bacterium]
MGVTFNAADRVGVVGGYIGGIASLLGIAGAGGGQAAVRSSCGGTCSENTLVDRFSLEQEKEIARLQSERDMLLSDQRNDGKMLELYKHFDGKLAETNRELARISATQAVTNQQVTDNLAFLDSKIESKQREMRCYVDATFVPGKLVMPLDKICPAAQPAAAGTTAASATAE